MPRKTLEFSTTVADPPWPYRSSGDHLRASHDNRPQSWDSHANSAGSAKRYGAMSIEEICNLQPSVAKNAHLYLWTTNSFLVEAHEVARAWGFEPKTILTWVKVRPDGLPSCKAGYYYRGATEHVVFGVRGSLRLRTKKAIPNVLLLPRLPHSVKPQEFFDMVKKLSPPFHLEMFARTKRPGWFAWGNEVECDVEIGNGHAN